MDLCVGVWSCCPIFRQRLSSRYTSGLCLRIPRSPLYSSPRTHLRVCKWTLGPPSFRLGPELQVDEGSSQFCIMMLLQHLGTVWSSRKPVSGWMDDRVVGRDRPPWTSLWKKDLQPQGEHEHKALPHRPQWELSRAPGKAGAGWGQ